MKAKSAVKQESVEADLVAGKGRNESKRWRSREWGQISENLTAGGEVGGAGGTKQM